MELGLYKVTLDAIEANHRDVNRCFIECLTRWLKRYDEVDRKGLPTWLRLANALKVIRNRDKAAAEKIRKKS